MAKEKSELSFQKQVFDMIEKISDRNIVIVIPAEVLRYSEHDIDTAIVLSQLIYWADKGSSPDGYIYKTYPAWREETGLSEYRIKKAAKKLGMMGILHTKNKRANGSPTVHYRLERNAFIDAFVKFLTLDNEKFKNGNINIEDSITEITSKITPEIIKKHKGAKSKDIRSYLSFKELSKGLEIEKEISEGISYYMQKYKDCIGKEHPRLIFEQWEKVIKYYKGFASKHDADLDSFKLMIDKHFITKYKDCDYNIPHSISDGVMLRRMYEVAY